MAVALPLPSVDTCNCVRSDHEVTSAHFAAKLELGSTAAAVSTCQPLKFLAKRTVHSSMRSKTQLGATMGLRAHAVRIRTYRTDQNVQPELAIAQCVACACPCICPVHAPLRIRRTLALRRRWQRSQRARADRRQNRAAIHTDFVPCNTLAPRSCSYSPMQSPPATPAPGPHTTRPLPAAAGRGP